MSLSRRRLLKVLGGAAVTAVAASAVAYRSARGRAADAYRRLVELPADDPLGPLPAETLETLLAATRGLLPEGVALARYEDFLRFHAEEAPGYRGLYERFARALDALAQREGSTFRGAPPEVQRAILGKLARVRETLNAGDALAGAWLALFDRDWLLYERYVSREILTLFARTDAWTLSGYGPHPGLPRGLEAYRLAPEAEKGSRP